MAIATNCPSCDAKFKLSDELEGKTVKCKRCQSSFVVPAADGIATKPTAKASSRPDDRDDEDDDRDEAPRLRKSRRRREDDEDEDRDDEDDEDEPRRRSKRKEKRGRKKKKGSSMLALTLILVGVGVLLLVVCGVGGTVAVIKLRNPGGPGGAMAGAAVTPVVLGADNTFRHENRLTRFDRIKDNRRYRTYSMQMEAGKTYQIDMISNHLDSYLFILDDTGRVVAEDDDSGGALNSRIIFRPDRTGEFRIETTSFDPGETGTFLLVARRF